MSKHAKSERATEKQSKSEVQDDPKLRERIGNIVQTAGGVAYAKELFGISREACVKFLAGPAAGRSHAGTHALIRANEGSAEKRAKAIAAERAAEQRNTANEKTVAAEKKHAKTKKRAEAVAS